MSIAGDAEMTYTTLIDSAAAQVHIADRGWVFVDCRFDIRDTARCPREYLVSHIKGAVYVDLDKDMSGPIRPGRTGRHPLPDPDSLVGFSQGWESGRGPRSLHTMNPQGRWRPRVCGGSSSGRGTMRRQCLTAASRRGPARACRAGSGPGSRTPSVFAASFRPELAVDARQVLSVMEDPGWVVLDARTADRYRGENETIDPVAGHIPGAVSAPYGAAIAPDGLFKPAGGDRPTLRIRHRRPGPGAHHRVLRLGGDRGSRGACLRPRGQGNAPAVCRLMEPLDHRQGQAHGAIGALPFVPYIDTYGKEETAAETCAHLDQIRDVSPSAEGCEDCLKTGDSWVHLRLCLTCGHVGCCDQSKNKHATKHFHGTGHPLIKSIEPGEDWMWCYVDEIAFE